MKIALILLIPAWAALVVDCNGISNKDEKDAARPEPPQEPPFPHIFNPEQIGSLQRLHIISETVSERRGYSTVEEYFDFEAARSTIVETGSGGETRTTHIDSVADLIFSYKPYTCDLLLPNELEAMPGFDDGIWDTTLKLPRNEGDSGQPITMRLYGVAGLWYNFGSKAKSYSKVANVYSSQKDLIKEAHRWTTVKDDNEIHFYFHALDETDSAKFTLELIQIESISTKKIVKSVNIMAAEPFSSDLDIYANLLQVPIGYGCIDPRIPERRRDFQPTLDSLYFGSPPDKLKLEMTVMKYDYDEKGQAIRKGDTISVELAKRLISIGKQRGYLSLYRQIDSNSDIKMVANQPLNIFYKIDVRKGTCEMSNLGERKKMNQDTGEAVSFSFSNGLKLVLDSSESEGDFFKTFLVDNDQFQYVKRIKDDEGHEFLYFEKQSVYGGRRARFIRRVSKDSFGGGELESVSLWIFNDDYSRVLETYQINIIGRRDIHSPVELAQLFDVSDECYLNNDEMKANHDYATIILTYSTTIHLLETMSDYENEFKRQFYLLLRSKSNIDFFQAPKMELLFGETGLVLRVMLLDLPPVHLQYEQIDEKRLVIEEGSSDSKELAVDVKHCSELCRLNQCKSMSYCKDHTCLISFQWDYARSKAQLVQDPDCTTYIKPATTGPAATDNALNASQSSLHSILNTMRFEDYNSAVAPKLPDELAYPMRETGIDKMDFDRVATNYLTNLYEAIEAQGHQHVPLLVFDLTINGDFFLMMANKFQIEGDPLSDFGLVDNGLLLHNNDQDDDEFGVLAFHQGLNMHRYKTQVFKTDDDDSRMMRGFSGLNYDQCALACVDSSCDSFSYCEHSKDCIITNIYDIANVTQDLIVTDIDCSIYQRDYLSQFNKFEGIYVPGLRDAHKVQNAAECAHSCIIDKRGCLAFDLQTIQVKDGFFEKWCYLLESRVLNSGGTTRTAEDEKDGQKRHDYKENGLRDHYSRAYLADFLRISYKKIEQTALADFRTTLYDGRTVNQCAELCATEILDCTAFQFCFDASASGAKQKCTLIEGKPNNKTDFEVSVNETDGKISKTGQMFKKSADCHVFVLKPTSSEARNRDLAFDIENSDKSQEIEQSTVNGMSLGSGLILFISTTILSAGIACGLFVYKDRNEFIRQKIERARILMGLPIH